MTDESREKAKARSKRWRESHPEKSRQNFKDWYAKNKKEYYTGKVLEARMESCRKYQQRKKEDPEAYKQRCNERQKKYYQAHREELLIKKRERNRIYYRKLKERRRMSLEQKERMEKEAEKLAEIARRKAELKAAQKSKEKDEIDLMMSRFARIKKHNPVSSESCSNCAYFNPSQKWCPVLREWTMPDKRCYNYTKRTTLIKPQTMKKTILILAMVLNMIPCAAQTISEVKAEIIRQRLPHPEIVLAQARLETGNFKSTMCKTKHNLFSIKHGEKYASYKRWQDSVADYKKRISSRYKSGEDYYSFLKRIGYARDTAYANKVRHIVNTSK